MARDRIDLLLKLREHSWDKEGWFVPLAGALKDVTEVEAAWQPSGGNTIWQTVNHINYYNGRLLNRLTGIKSGVGANSNTATFGETGNRADAEAWKATLAETHRIAEGLHEALAQRTDADLDKPLAPKSDSTLGAELTDWMSHDAYHTGQIVLLRKQQGSWPATRE